MFGESTSDNSFATDDQKTAGRYVGTGQQQHSTQRVRRHSASRGRSHHNNPSVSDSGPNSTANNQFFDDLLIEDDFNMLDTSSHLIERNLYIHDSLNSTKVTLDGSDGSQSANSSVCSPEMQWLSDEDEGPLEHNFSDPEVDQITSNSSHLSDRALRALSRAPQYHSTF